jgi:hypothetical protein
MEMARAWHVLAEQAERNSKLDLVYEPPPVRAERQAVVQQQQAQVPPNADASDC